MKKNNKRNIVIISVVAVVVLGVLVSVFGNVGVRRSILGEDALSVTSPLVPGVPFTVGWTVDNGDEDRSVLLKLRLTSGESELNAARYTAGGLTATLPCDALPGDGSLILVELLTNKVVAQQPVSVLAPGQDCAQ